MLALLWEFGQAMCWVFCEFAQSFQPLECLVAKPRDRVCFEPCDGLLDTTGGFLFGELTTQLKRFVECKDSHSLWPVLQSVAVDFEEQVEQARLLLFGCVLSEQEDGVFLVFRFV